MDFFCDFSIARKLAEQGDSAKYFYSINEHLKDPKSAFLKLDPHVRKICPDFCLHPGGFRQEISWLTISDSRFHGSSHSKGMRLPLRMIVIGSFWPDL